MNSKKKITMFTCRVCKCEFRTIVSYNKHQFAHRKLPHLNINCLYPGCNTTFAAYKKFKSHVYCKHGRETGTNLYTCNVLNCTYGSTDRLTFNKHMKEHLQESPDGIKCPFKECLSSRRRFFNASTYNSHISRRHYQKDISHEPEDIEMQQLEENSVEEVANVENNVHFPGGSESVESPPIEIANFTQLPPVDPNTFNNKETDAAAPTEFLAQLSLILTTKHHTTEPALQDIIQKTSRAFEVCKKRFLSYLESGNLSGSDKIATKKSFEDSFNGLTNAIDERVGCLRNTYQRKQYYLRNVCPIIPRQIQLIDTDGIGSGFHYSYVPILDTLKSMLKNEIIREYCEKTQSSVSTEVLFDILDGSLAKSNPLLQITNNILYIMLYADAFEICNPLGSSKKRFKIVGVYMMLANVPPDLRTKRDNIELVMLCLESYITKFGWKTVLDEVIKDLKSLESDGIEIIVEGKLTTYLGTLLVMLGDSLGSHQIGGLTENFSKAHYFCRYCTIHRDRFHNDLFCEREWRNPENYDTSANVAAQSGTMQFGIKDHSALNQLHYFHVANPGLPPCIAHDIFEGIVLTDMWLAIRYFVEKKWFREGLLNFRLNDIKLLTEGALFIPPVNVTKTSRKKLVGSASQMRRLVLILPVAIADRVKDFDDPVWQMVLHLRNICSLICAHAISIGQIATMKAEIESYLFLRVQCFPDVRLIPKHEFVLHYPKLTSIFGPLSHVSTLHCECKHGDFKSRVRHLANFKNITQTLAEKHQLKDAAISFKDDALVSADHVEEYVAKEHDATNESISECFTDNSNQSKFLTNKVSFRGVLYKAGMCVCIGKNKTGNFEICRMKKIVINETFTSICFIGMKEEVILNVYVGLYESNKYDDERICASPYSSLLSPDPFPEVEIASVPIFVPKYAPYNPDF